VGGQVVCDADGKLNAESVLLEGSPNDGGQQVRLDLSSLSNYSLFPGQIISVEGLNNVGTKLVAQQSWSDSSPTDPPSPVDLPGSFSS